MGGDSLFLPNSSIEDDSSLRQCFPHESVKSSVSSGSEVLLNSTMESDSVIKGDGGFSSAEVPDPRISLISEAAERQKVKVYTEVSKSYEYLRQRIDRLEEAKRRILSYSPGSWAVKATGMDLHDIVVPSTTSLLIIGPSGSGKSSLVNKISRVLEDDAFVLGRAQVSCNSSTEGTYFLHEYKIPRGLGSFSLYDTRGLSVDLSENLKMLKCWMRKGVRHGELIKRKSDKSGFKALLKCRTERRSRSGQFKPVNFVIFVVNGIHVLESMEGVGQKQQQYSQMIAKNFDNPLLSFKDDKPVVVVTHGDLLTLSDRVKIRVYLGELLGIPPATQIFDIPDNNDPATSVAIVDMIMYCLDRADRNLPSKDLFVFKNIFTYLWPMMILCAMICFFFIKDVEQVLLLIVVAIAAMVRCHIDSTSLTSVHTSATPSLRLQSLRLQYLRLQQRLNLIGAKFDIYGLSK